MSHSQPSRGNPRGVLDALDTLQAGLDALRASLVSLETSAAVRMVSVKEAARCLGMHERTLRRNPERYGGVKAGGAWRFHPARLRVHRD